MSRLQEIENRLSSINETIFQELCDSYLKLKNNNYRAFSRVGSQSGKQKTTKGTPDSFFLLPNGNFLYVEATTNQTDKDKLSKDIDACFDSKKTKIPINKIEEIILCFNWNINQGEILKLDTRAQNYNKNVVIRYLMLDDLALELESNHRDLVHEYLDLPLDTGQIVSIKTFIDEYNKVSQGITPIDNTFLHRKEEFKEFKSVIHSHDFIILTGAPGVGKTKLALEGIKSFLSENLDFEAYCVSYKHHTLLDDLFQCLYPNKNHILFVDDANRIDAFSQIIGFYKALRTGKLKVIITVRNYAFQEIKRLCQEFTPKRMNLLKFSDDQIIEIIKQKPFEILNSNYPKEIVRIADGNPRIAIMAALLARKEQNIYALRDVSGLFENYFSTFIKDDGEFAKDLNIKCLGLIAFFYAIPKDKEVITSLLVHFKMDYSSFIDSIDKLGKLELVDIQFEYVKIPEQNLSMYFFYKAFIKDDLLSFEMLLINYYERNKNRFKDCVISANNTFGAEKVMDKLQPFLKSYWKSIQNDEEKGFDFLSTFCFYLSIETFEFVYNIVKKLPEAHSENYEVTYENNAFSYNRNSVLELMQNFFTLEQNDLKEAIRLVFEYVRKKPEYLSDLLHKICERLVFDTDDEEFSFRRRTDLFEILLEGLNKKDTLYAVAFYELSKIFLEYQHHHTKGGRKPHSLCRYQYPLSNNKVIQGFRASIWNAINENYINYPDESFNLLEYYSTISYGVIKEIMELDVPFVLTIIENHLKTESFDHCKYVQYQVRWFKRNSISHRSFDSLIDSFRNSTYEIYLKIDWNRFGDKERREFDDYREYGRLKEEELRTSFVLTDEGEVNDFFKVFCFLKEKTRDEWDYNNSLDFVVDENYKRNPKVGIALLLKIIESNNQINYVPGTIFRNHLKTNDAAMEIWSMLQKSDFHLKPHWELSFYDYLDEALLDKKYVEALIDTVSNMQGSNIIHFDQIQCFLSIKPDLFQIILRKIVKKNEEGARLSVCTDFFSTHFNKLGDDFDLIKKAYIQQDEIQNPFDYGCKGLLNILNKTPEFLVEYVDSLYSEKQHSFLDNRKLLGFVWQVNNIEPILKGVFDLVVNKEEYLGISEHFCNAFFRNIPKASLEKAKDFLLEYVRENYGDYKKMNAVVDIARYSMKNIFEEILLLFVSLNQDVDVFSKIWWTDRGVTYIGDVIIGYIREVNWRNILSIVEKSNVGIDLIPIKGYLNEKIESCSRSGDWERKGRFLGLEY